MNKVVAMTTWNDPTGIRVAITYNVIDEATRSIVKSNIKKNIVLTKDSEVKMAQDFLNFGQSIAEIFED